MLTELVSAGGLAAWHTELREGDFQLLIYLPWTRQVAVGKNIRFTGEFVGCFSGVSEPRLG